MFFQIRIKEIINMFFCGKLFPPILKGNNSRQQDISVPVYAGKGSECDKNVSRALSPYPPTEEDCCRLWNEPSEEEGKDGKGEVR